LAAWRTGRQQPAESRAPGLALSGLATAGQQRDRLPLEWALLEPERQGLGQPGRERTGEGRLVLERQKDRLAQDPALAGPE
jgi:hypothetical protein